MSIAKNLQFSCRALRFEMDHLRQLQLPAIVHWDMDHFVVLKKATRNQVILHDPAVGVRRISISEAAKHLTGIALELFPSEGFKRVSEKSDLKLAAFWQHMRGTSHALWQVFVLSVILELFVIASPFYLQITIDEVIGKGDADLPLALALGFGLVAAVMVVSTAIRAFILLVLQASLNLQMGGRLFRHLIRLPISYFEKRHIGDVLSRFLSLEPIRNLLAEGLVVALIDGMMAAATLVMMFIYSAELTFVVLAAFGLYLILRLMLFRMLRDRTQDVIVTKAKESDLYRKCARDPEHQGLQP